MSEVFICGYRRTPIGRYGGVLSKFRPDDLLGLVFRSVISQLNISSSRIDLVVAGCANQAGEDARNVARMSALLADIPVEVPATTINRLCGSGMDAILYGYYAILSGEVDLVLVGGVESMSRAPYVLSKATGAFDRNIRLFDTTIGARFPNPLIEERFGIHSMPETAANVATEFDISREDQDLFSLRSQTLTNIATSNGRIQDELISAPCVSWPSSDEHPRPQTTFADLSKLPVIAGTTITAGNSAGINDGAASVLLASENAVRINSLYPIAKITGGASSGVAPHLMGLGPIPAVRKLLERLGFTINDFGVIEINEAFASQVLACLRSLQLADDEDRVNPNGGSIALGHPLGMSGTRLVGTAALELRRRREKRALASMCIGVGQGIAISLESAAAF